jgi:predicted MFS family arabinose efflux permease
MPEPGGEAGRTPVRPIDGGLVALLAVATGVAVASNYYVQPLLPTIRHHFHAGAGAAGLVVTAAQVGYAAGLLFLLPLGDLFERRRLVVILSSVTVLGLLGAALSPDLDLLYVAALVIGASSVVAQILVAFAASLASDVERGKVVGTVMSGLLIGILLARTAAGYLGAFLGWRAVYFAAGGLALVLVVVMRLALPQYREGLRSSYAGVLVSVVTIFREQPVLRRRSLYGALSFAAFSVLWTSLAFLLAGAPYRYGSGTIGLFGLVGVAGAVMASVAGRLADRGLQAAVTVAASAAIVVSFVLLWLGQNELGVLLVAVVALDLGCQGLHITNQSQIYRLLPEARSRVNAGYMTSYFVGGTVGSVGSALCYAAFGWHAVCGLGAAIGAVALAFASGERRFDRNVAPPARAGAAGGAPSHS